ncbi:hypothetical protein EVAR_45725_1 [Eumeta japonica]|uniref:Ig-like domain-containing protein n=1 Tax=Eumeta variegata TaxID=151549 RepID=A0A4C1WWX3_EUMVA|nr:hypothetical protein EVAR_45725_1 [Eumeta japonica]
MTVPLVIKRIFRIITTKEGSQRESVMLTEESFNQKNDSSPGAGGLRTTELKITPSVVQRGRNVTMACIHQLHDYGVYSVKWYKGNHEFYRYSPLDTPTTRLIPANGIKIDRLRSNETHVVLISVGPTLSGNYSCEVIQNSPSYPQYVATARLDVVECDSEIKSTSLEPKGTRLDPRELTDKLLT